MASRAALVLLLNIIFFTLVSSSYDVPCPPPPSTLKDHHGHEYPPPTYNTVTCPMDALKLKVCANVLNLVDVVVGQKSECCALIKDLVDLEAAICLCTALKANVMGINLNVLVSLSLVLNHCGKNIPSDFQCA